MSFSFILDVVIGLVFIYLTLSLLSSGVQELLATLLQWRAAHLKKAIEILLAGDNVSEETIAKSRKLLQDIYSNPLMEAVSQEARGGIEAWFRQVTRAIVTLGRNQLTLKGNEPSYIPSETFAATLLEKLNLAKIAHDLTVLKLKTLLGQDILSRIEKLLDAQPETPESERLRTNLNTLKASFNEILVALQSGKISLQTSVYRIRSELNSYIQKTSLDIQTDKVSSSNDVSSVQETLRENPLIRQLLLLQRDVFYDDESFDYSNVNEIIRWLEPSLSEVLNVFLSDESIDSQQHKQLEQTYQAIRANAQKIAQDLPQPLQQSLASLARQAEVNLSRTTHNQFEHLQDEVRQFKVEIQKWFDRAMDRTSGVYKRNAKGIGFLIGFSLAIALNADTLHITQQLAMDATLRNILVSNTDLISQSCTPVSQKTTIESHSKDSEVLDCINRTVQQEVPLPIGWSDENTKLQTQQVGQSQLPFATYLRRPFGWIITGFAISMGASFWFDLLGKAVNVRNTGKKPATDVDTVSQKRTN